MSKRFTEAEIAEVWERRGSGEATRSIARRLGRNGSSIRRLFEDAGGVRPAPRRRAERHLTLLEREEISRGVAAGESLRAIASRLGRAPSTISREVAGNGGRLRYRAHRADRAAWGRARRPQRCKLATNPALRAEVEDNWEIQSGKGTRQRRTETRPAWTKTEALAYAHDQQNRAAKTPWASASVDVPSFSEYADRTAKVRPMRPSTRSKERSLWKRIDQHLGSWPINTISPSHLRAFVDELATDLSPGYVRDIYNLVAMVFDYAVADEVISQSPSVRIPLPKRERAHVRAADPREVQLLVEHIDPRYSALVSFLAVTGCRIGEALAVKVSDITELPRFQVTIGRSVSTDESGREVLVDRLKSDASYRTVTLPDWLRASLQRQIASRELGVDSFLFAAPAGRWLPTRRFRARFWSPACREAGVEITPHELRHLHASMLIEAGRPLTEIAARLGHESPAITMSIYAHWLREDDSGSAEVIPEISVNDETG